MSGSRAIRLSLMTLLASMTLGLTGDPASGARAKLKERADLAAIRNAPWDGMPDGWAKVHHRYVDRARRADAPVVFLGDSITYAWGDETRDDHGRMDWLAEFSPMGAVNFGFPGDQTQHLIHRIEDGELAGHPKAAVVLIGTNNLADGQSPVETASGVAAVVQAIRQASPDTRILLVGLLPREFNPDAPLRHDVNQVNAIVRGWADEADLEFVDAGSPFLDHRGWLKLDLTKDGIHPTRDGYRLLAQAIREPLRKILSGK